VLDHSTPTINQIHRDPSQCGFKFEEIPLILVGKHSNYGGATLIIE
ncbi:uncharacterized protein METZ01_LOCUS397483, partial [marine metagenome]